MGCPKWEQRKFNVLHICWKINKKPFYNSTHTCIYLNGAAADKEPTWKQEKKERPEKDLWIGWTNSQTAKATNK